MGVVVRSAAGGGRLLIRDGSVGGSNEMAGKSCHPNSGECSELRGRTEVGGASPIGLAIDNAALPPNQRHPRPFSH